MKKSPDSSRWSNAKMPKALPSAKGASGPDMDDRRGKMSGVRSTTKNGKY